MTRPGDSDVIAGGEGGMRPCPPPQHQQPGGVYNLHTKDIHCISQIYTIYIASIYMVYTDDIQ
jgi:hypothetical protein